MRRFVVLLICLGCLSYPTLSFCEVSELEQAEWRVESAVGDEKSDAWAQLAILQAQHQYQERAFHSFIQALEARDRSSQPVEVSEEERALYEEALAIYLDISEHPVRTAVKLQETYQPVMEKHPDYLLLNFIVASSYANMGRFAEYFEQFYSSAKAHPDHYLVDKACGILYVKLTERAQEEADRDRFRSLAVKALERSLEKDLADMMVYKVLFQLWNDQERAASVSVLAKRVIDEDVQLGRTEIFPFVQRLVEEGDLIQAQELINRGKQWYQYSRSINNAQKLIDRKRNG